MTDAEFIMMLREEGTGGRRPAQRRHVRFSHMLAWLRRQALT